MVIVLADYMYNRWIFTLDPERFPLEKMRAIVSHLHSLKQHYIVMVDPAVALQEYTTYENGAALDVFLKEPAGHDNAGSYHKGVVWPGVTVFPDWTHPNTQPFWNQEFKRFFDKDQGVDVDGIWIDMNEPASFCTWPCDDPEAEAIKQEMPPARKPVREQPRPIPGFPEFDVKRLSKRADGDIDLLSPPYAIKNAAGKLSDKTAHTDVIHASGNSEYDTHNLYGSHMSTATYDASLARRPGVRPFIITRSTFVGAGTKVGKWLGDNLSTWYHYTNSISGILGFGALYQIPLVGADICGFGGNTTEILCARWTTLGAFYPFSRNHNGDTSISQEPYLWPIVSSAAQKAYKIRYELLDYFYTALRNQELTGTPAIKPLFFTFPKDKKTFAIDTQFFYGPSLVVAPVTKENATDVNVYLPAEAKWYDYVTLKPVKGGNRTLTNVAFDEIPLFVKGGEIIVRRSFGEDLPMTTADVREYDFEVLVFPDAKGRAEGELYVDDGESLEGRGVTVKFSYKNGKVNWKRGGKKGQAIKVAKVTVAGGKKKDWKMAVTEAEEGEVEV